MSVVTIQGKQGSYGSLVALEGNASSAGADAS